MISFSLKSSSALALLAIGLQVALTAMGGRLCCYQTGSMSTDDCRSERCCERLAPTETGDTAASHTVPACPGDADCCIESDRAFFVPSTVQTQIRPLTLVAPVLMPAVVSHPGLAYRSHKTLASVERAAHPPPSLAVVRTTVLHL